MDILGPEILDAEFTERLACTPEARVVYLQLGHEVPGSEPAAERERHLPGRSVLADTDSTMDSADVPRPERGLPVIYHGHVVIELGTDIERHCGAALLGVHLVVTQESRGQGGTLRVACQVGLLVLSDVVAQGGVGVSIGSVASVGGAGIGRCLDYHLVRYDQAGAVGLREEGVASIERVDVVRWAELHVIDIKDGSGISPPAYTDSCHCFGRTET